MRRSVLFLDVDRRLRSGTDEVLVHLWHHAVVRRRGVARRRVPHHGRRGARHGEVGGVSWQGSPHHLTLRWRRGDHLVVGRVAVPGRVAGREVVVREVRVVSFGRPRQSPGRVLAVVGVV